MNPQPAVAPGEGELGRPGEVRKGERFRPRGPAPTVLQSTFLHLTGIDSNEEWELWSSGTSDWASLKERLRPPMMPLERGARLQHDLLESERALAARDAGWFARRLPRSEHWRLYPTFRPETAFLDIETTSLSPYSGIVTVVSVHGNGTTRSFVADEDLEELPAYLRTFPILVTFNGSLFDVPFLQVRFPSMVPPPAHIDLRFVLRRLGLVGGLKRIEQLLDLGSRDGVEGIHGLDAVRLWESYRRGNTEALDRLVRYNRADTENLVPLLEFAVRELEQRLRAGRRTPHG